MRPPMGRSVRLKGLPCRYAKEAGSLIVLVLSTWYLDHRAATSSDAEGLD